MWSTSEWYRAMASFSSLLFQAVPDFRGQLLIGIGQRLGSIRDVLFEFVTGFA